MIEIGKMSLESRYNTPRRGVVGLPGDEGDGTRVRRGRWLSLSAWCLRLMEGEADREWKVLMVDTTNGTVPVNMCGYVTPHHEFDRFVIVIVIQL
jgi:hypothetical protein